MATLKDQGWYKRKAWKSLRRQALERDHYLCRFCLDKGRFTAATEVHHINELEAFPELGLELDNLTSLCRACHERTKRHPKRGGKRVPIGVRVIRVGDGE